MQNAAAAADCRKSDSNQRKKNDEIRRPNIARIAAHPHKFGEHFHLNFCAVNKIHFYVAHRRRSKFVKSYFIKYPPAAFTETQKNPKINLPFLRTQRNFTENKIYHSGKREGILPKINFPFRRTRRNSAKINFPFRRKRKNFTENKFSIPANAGISAGDSDLHRNGNAAEFRKKNAVIPAKAGIYSGRLILEFPRILREN